MINKQHVGHYFFNTWSMYHCLSQHRSHGPIFLKKEDGVNIHDRIGSCGKSKESISFEATIQTRNERMIYKNFAPKFHVFKCALYQFLRQQLCNTYKICTQNSGTSGTINTDTTAYLRGSDYLCGDSERILLVDGLLP